MRYTGFANCLTKRHQIVLLVTKAVGDFLGTTGIADEMIKFNGYPFLEKDDHAYNVPGTTYRYVYYIEIHQLLSLSGNENRSPHPSCVRPFC